jgi:hypothetical protein
LTEESGLQPGQEGNSGSQSGQPPSQPSTSTGSG